MKSLVAAIVTDVKNLNAQFFKLPKNHREKELAQKLGEYPRALSAYLLDVSAESFLENISALFESLVKVRPSNNPLAAAIARATTSSGAAYIDALQDKAPQKELEKILGKNNFANAFQVLVAQSPTEELFNRLWYSVKLGGEFSRIIVQTARPLTYAEKREFREQLGNDVLAVFQVVPGVLGGMRIFTPEGLVDASWRKHIEKLGHLAN